MKTLALIVVMLALIWFGITRFGTAKAPLEPSRVAASPAPLTPSVNPAPPPVAVPVPAPATAPTAASPLVEVAKATVLSTAAPEIVLENVLGPNNLYPDDLLGVSATLPDGWTVRGAGRWGENNRENTVSLSPETETTARPSMYYQMYPKEVPEPGQAEAYLRNIAEWKENSRISAGLADYKNVPESFAFTDINGNPSLSYFATFTRGNEVMTEYFVRILGKKGYVMFFTQGRLEDVKAIMPPLQKMAGSVKVP